MTIEDIKSLMKSGDIAGAETAAQELLTSEPDSAEAQMLYGTCRQLRGDNKTFGEIHDALAPKMEAERDEKTLSLWRRYHKLWMALLAGGLVLAGVAVGAWYFGGSLRDKLVVADEMVAGKCVYAGPQRDELKPTPVEQGRLYGGPTRVELRKLDKGRTCPLCNGTGLTPQKTLCESCGGYGKGRVQNGDSQ